MSQMNPRPSDAASRAKGGGWRFPVGALSILVGFFLLPFVPFFIAAVVMDTPGGSGHGLKDVLVLQLLGILWAAVYSASIACTWIMMPAGGICLLLRRAAGATLLRAASWVLVGNFAVSVVVHLCTVAASALAKKPIDDDFVLCLVWTDAGLLVGLAWPLFLLLWLRRPRIKEQIGRWGAERKAARAAPREDAEEFSEECLEMRRKPGVAGSAPKCTTCGGEGTPLRTRLTALAVVFWLLGLLIFVGGCFAFVIGGLIEGERLA